MDNSEFVSNLNNALYSKLANALTINKNWLEVVNILGILSQTTITQISYSENPGKLVLDELSNRCCPVAGLKLILKECGLYDALDIIADPEPMRIIKQIDENVGDPFYVDVAKKLELSFIVHGFPLPQYCWIKDNIPVVPEQNTSKLIIEKFGPNDEGEYWCQAIQKQQNGSIFTITSNSLEVCITPIPCKIIEQPVQCLYHREGSSLTLSCKATGYPGPFYSWYYENTDLNEHESTLEISNPDENFSGKYRCFITNHVDEVYTRISQVKVLRKTKPLKGKLALLIANEEYDNFDTLQTPGNDVCTLSENLKELGFEIISYLNLTYSEMSLLFERFSLLIEEDMYIFIYFCGHGFEYNKNKYMIPVDSPGIDDNMLDFSICEDVILQKILKQNPRLVISLFDMCLKMPSISSNISNTTPIPKCLSNKNLIQAYSTSSNRSSYESNGKFNGFYVDILKNIIKNNTPVLNIFIETQKKLHNDIGDVLREQIPCLSSDIADDFFLNEPTSGNYRYSTFIKKLGRLKKFKTKFNFLPRDTVDAQISFYRNWFVNSLQLSFDKNTPITCKSLTPNVKFEVIIDTKSINFIFSNLQKTSKSLKFVLYYDNKKGDTICLQDTNLLLVNNIVTNKP